MKEKKTKIPLQNALVEDEQAIYQIRVKGLLDERWSDYLSGFTIMHHADDISVLVGEVRDQAALFGVLIKIRDLGIPLIAFERLEKTHKLKSKPETQIRKGYFFSAVADKIKQLLANQNDVH